MKRFSRDFKTPRHNTGRNVLIVENDQSMEPVSITKTGPAQYFSKIFESREMAHVYHLQLKGSQGSYAQHIALGEYYEGILDILDELVEVYQGQYDVVEGYNIIDTQNTQTQDTLEYFTQTVEFLKTQRYTLLSQDDPHYQAIIDEIINLMYRLIYKLRFLK